MASEVSARALKDLCQNSEIDTPEKELVIKKTGTAAKCLVQGKEGEFVYCFVVFVRFW